MFMLEMGILVSSTHKIDHHRKEKMLWSGDNELKSGFMVTISKLF